MSGKEPRSGYTSWDPKFRADPALRVRNVEEGKGGQRSGKSVGSGGPEGITEKQRGVQGAQAARREGAMLALTLASQTQGCRVLFGFQSEIGDAGVLAGGLGCSSGSHYRGGGGRVRG